MFQIVVWKTQEYFVYFKFFKPKSWDKRFAECRWLFIQSFPSFSNRKVRTKDSLSADGYLFRVSLVFVDDGYTVDEVCHDEAAVDRHLTL